jgi:hypothetical protein
MVWVPQRIKVACQIGVSDLIDPGCWLWLGSYNFGWLDGKRFLQIAAHEPYGISNNQQHLAGRMVEYG